MSLEILITNLGNMLPFLKYPAFWVATPMWIFFGVLICKKIYRSCVYVVYSILRYIDNRRLKRKGEKPIKYEVDWYEDDPEQNPKQKHKYWW